MARLFFYRSIAAPLGYVISLRHEENHFTGFAVFPADCLSIGLQHGHARMGTDL